MKRGVNTVTRGELYPITHLVYSPQDFKRPHKPRTQLPAGQAEGQVPGREPDLVPRCEHWDLTAVTVSARLLPPFGPFKVPVGGLSGLLRAPHPFVHHRSLGLALMPRYQNRLITQHTLEG